MRGGRYAPGGSVTFVYLAILLAIIAGIAAMIWLVW